MLKKIGMAILLILVIGVVGVGTYRFILSMIPDDGSALREDMEYLNDKVDLSILLYGEDVEFPKELEYEKIESLEDKKWQRDNDYVYLIINDLNGTTNFEKEEFVKLVEYADQNTNFNFYYIGTDKLEMIDTNIQDSNLDDSDMSFGYIINEGVRLIHLGVWSKNDHQYLKMSPELLSESIYSAVLMNIKSNE